MKRSAMAHSTKPMKRSPMKRSAKLPGTVPSFSGGKPEVKPKRMKSRRPKMTAMRRSARDEECTLRIAGQCLRTTDTTVLCHSNLLADGKGMGLKASDLRAAYGCDVCHSILDGRRPRPGWLSLAVLLDIFERAVVLTHERMRAKGLIP